jgi:DNA processing protein
MTRTEVTPEDLRRRKTFLQIRLATGLGLRSIHRLVAEIRKPEDILSLTVKELAAKSVPHKIARDLLSSEARDRAEKEWERASSLGIQIIDIRDPSYPALLLETCDPPLVLYVRSSSNNKGWDHRRPQIAVVGGRRASAYGINCAEQITRNLAALGIVIVSGLAQGIDTAAHRGALSGGDTVAVCGTELDRVYPSENRDLAESIVANGALLSEFGMGTPPLRANFPIRNRILAGMTLGTIVVEAGERPGSLITARLALEANHEVFAVPDPIFSPQSLGPHLLIREGACLIADWKDVVEEFGGTVFEGLDLSKGASCPEEPELSDPQRKVRDALSASEAIAIDTLLSKLDLPRSEIYSALFELAPAGRVRQLLGDRYVLRLS